MYLETKTTPCPKNLWSESDRKVCSVSGHKSCWMALSQWVFFLNNSLGDFVLIKIDSVQTALSCVFGCIYREEVPSGQRTTMEEK